MDGKLIKKRGIMQGSIAIAETVSSAEPGVIAAYPITPQTHIVEHLSRLSANGQYKGEYITVDSEFSAASVVFGASAAGVRSYTASASQGLLLMTEVIFHMAGTRLPGVISATNRSLAPPINIQVDHQDTMTMRDSGIIQIYVESIQEAIDTHVQIFKIAEHKDVLLPAMVCMDGWIITHVYEPVTLWKDEAIREFIPDFDPVNKLDPKAPVTFGAYDIPDRITEFKYMTHAALNNSKEKIKEVAAEFKDVFGNFYGDLIEEYYTEDAETILVAMGSMVGTLKVAVRKMRKEGKKVGLVKIRSFRPFPHEELRKVLAKASVVAVLDRSFSNSFGGILGGEIKSALYGSNGPAIVSYVIAIGGREVYPSTVEDVVRQSEEYAHSGKVPQESIFYNLKTELLK